ncbi:hypothetical protein HMPREF9104_02881 [Lentilactobacillus kisonensis F0435]|uniref:Uncharacterized protein n=1 Tax=Lentilactobacillus kisonensis F0435 TaxID=797516 RepID=H1LJT9_9LACO|nr:hypothetical protein HMPREF9104_02881 [Lentilactobacillus kisonensis F0435]
MNQFLNRKWLKLSFTWNHVNDSFSYFLFIFSQRAYSLNSLPW